MKTCIKSLLIISSLLLTGCYREKIPPTELNSIITIKYDNKTSELSDNSIYYLYSEKFDLIFNGLSEELAVSIFAHYSPEYQNTLNFPVKTNETTIFNPGCAMAENPIDVNKGYKLRVSDKYGFHYVSSDRRINNENEAVIPVTSISDSTGCFTNNLYLSLFVDFNQNQIIEENEYTTINIHFYPTKFSSELDFSDNKRGYFSSMGYSLLKEKFSYTGRDFRIYKITSHEDFLKVAEKENSNLNNMTLEEMTKHRFDDKYLVDECAYICFIPEGYTQIGNTFRLKGSQTIYMEVIPDKPENERSINIRHFSLSTKSPEPEISFYYDGTLITPQVIRF